MSLSVIVPTRNSHTRIFYAKLTGLYNKHNQPIVADV